MEKRKKIKITLIYMKLRMYKKIYGYIKKYMGLSKL